jgi:hypothetical protein
VLGGDELDGLTLPPQTGHRPGPPRARGSGGRRTVPGGDGIAGHAEPEQAQDACAKHPRFFRPHFRLASSGPWPPPGSASLAANTSGRESVADRHRQQSGAHSRAPKWWPACRSTAREPSSAAHGSAWPGDVHAVTVTLARPSDAVGSDAGVVIARSRHRRLGQRFGPGSSRSRSARRLRSARSRRTREGSSETPASTLAQAEVVRVARSPLGCALRGCSRHVRRRGEVYDPLAAPWAALTIRAAGHPTDGRARGHGTV